MILRRATAEVIFGVQLIDVDVFRDERGDLVAFEQPTNISFELKRVFYMRIDNATSSHLNHATSSDLHITPVTGSAVVDVDNGEERASLKLDTPDRGVRIRAGIYIRLRDFAHPTVLLVCASRHSAETRYFRAPQPELIEERVVT